MSKLDTVILELDRVRELRFGFKGLKIIEGMFGKPLLEIDLHKLKSDDIQKIIYAGLVSDDKELTLDEVEDIIDMINYMELIKKMNLAIAKAYGIEPDLVEKSFSNESIEVSEPDKNDKKK